MELLQNRRYEPGDIIPDCYFHEIRTQIDCMADTCREGEISVYEALNIIYGEILCSMDFLSELEKQLNNLENGIEGSAGVNIEAKFSFVSFTPEESANLEEIGKEWRIGDLEKAIEDMDKYNDFLTGTQEWLEGIFEDADYQKKRKTKIKQQIIMDGLQLSTEMADNSNVHTTSINDHSMNFLISHFKEEFAKDYPLLVNNGFIKKTEKGLRKEDKISKKFLTDYFNSIKPEGMIRIPWTMIGNIFGEKALKNSKSPNGKKYRESSEDFLRWLKLKKNLAGK
jgi:hypothetical protein